MKSVSHVPNARIKSTDNVIDLVVENLSFIITVETHNFIRFSLYSAIVREQHHEFTVTFGQMILET